MAAVNDTLLIHWLLKYKSIGVPELGCFSLSEEPAVMTRMGRDFEPPRCIIAFQSSGNSKNSLQSVLMTETGMTEVDAVYSAKEYSDSIIAAILQSGQYLMQGAGQLTQNSEGQYSFESCNEDAALTFGLSGFSAEIVAKPQEAAPMVVAKRRRRRVPVFIIIVLLLMAAGATAVFVFPEKVNPLWEEFTALFESNEKPSESTDTKTTDTTKTQVEPVIEQDSVASDTMAKETETNVKASNSAASFYLIGGSFTTRAEADELCAKLKQRGFPSEVIESPSEGRIRVSYKSFSTKDEALKSLNEIRVSENKPDIWLYTKK